MYHNISQVPFHISCRSDDTARSTSPDNSALYTPTQPMDLQPFENLFPAAEDVSAGDTLFHGNSEASCTSEQPFGVHRSAADGTFESPLTAGHLPVAQDGAYSHSLMVDPSILWDNGPNILDSQRSSPVLDEWALPTPQLITSTSSSPLDYSPSIGDMFPACTPKPSVVNDNSARDHPLYHNAAPKEDGFYHCPWESDPTCQHKPEKLKCNYYKCLDSHLKPYRCKVVSCKASGFSSTACLLRHEREAHAMHGHGDKPYLCIYEGCDRSLTGNGFPRHWNLRDHMRRVHNYPGPTKSSTSGSPPPSNAPVRGRNKREAEASDATAIEKPLERITTPRVLVRQSHEPSLVDRYLSSEQSLRETAKELHDPTNPSNIIMLPNLLHVSRNVMERQQVGEDYQRDDGQPKRAGTIDASNLLPLDSKLNQAPAVQLHPDKHDHGIKVSTDKEQAKSKTTATLPIRRAPKVSSARPEVPTLRLGFSNNIPSDVPDWQDQQNHAIESPSSAGTASAFSATDSSSSGEDECLLTRSAQKRVLLDRLMRYFYSIISACPSPGLYVREHGAGNGSSTCQTSGDHRHSYQGQSPAHSSNSTSSILGKRQAESDDGDGCARRRPRLELNDPADDQSKRLACPFFKKDPRQYQGGSRSCSGPGWFTVHRIKEHIYRNHTLPISCPRCNQVFQTDRLKDEHIQAVQRCEVRDPIGVIEGIDSTQKERLRSRKKMDKHKTEADKWNDMYLILFPDINSTCIPSPYYEYSNLTDPSALLSPNQEFVRYEQFLRRELPSRVRLQLEVRIEERLSPVEEGLRSELVEIVREMQLQLFEIYKSSRTTGLPVTNTAAQMNDNAEPHGNEADGFGEGQGAQIWSVEDQLQPFYQPPHLENFNLFDDFDDFDGLFFNFPEMQSDSIAVDSDYVSLPSVNSRELEEHENDPVGSVRHQDYQNNRNIGRVLRLD